MSESGVRRGQSADCLQRELIVGMIKHLMAPIRSLVRFPLFQLAVVVAVILLLQAADEKSVFGQIFNSLDRLVDLTVQSLASILGIKSFTKSWLTSGFWIAYVYLACLFILYLLRLLANLLLDLMGRHNVFWLRNAIARERGIAAYRAWVPFEKIRPAHIPQQQWEERFAWPADNSPPYLPLWRRLACGTLGYVVVIAIACGLFQLYSPFPVLTWLGVFARMLLG